MDKPKHSEGKGEGKQGTGGAARTGWPRALWAGGQAALGLALCSQSQAVPLSGLATRL